MDQTRARRLLADARVARLATVSGDGIPHLVPVTFAVDEDKIVIAIDHKPKTTMNLRRLRNIRENPSVCVLADVYDDDWTQLWWARADGQAVIVEEAEEGETRQVALDLLARKYGQYREQAPDAPMIIITVTRWSGWAYSE